jgi:uncharacterized protein (PEP-CTERM system associated)
MQVANTATVDTAMDQKFKVFAFALFSLPSICSAQSQSAAPIGTAATAVDGIDVKEKRGLTFLPGVRLSSTYSDNIGLKANGEQSGGFRFEMSPYVFASINNDQATGQTYLSLRNFYQSADPRGTYTGRIDFRGNGTLNVYDNWFFLEGSGFAYNVNPLNFGPAAFDAASVRAFPYRFQGGTAAPYIAGSLGTSADYRAQYSYGVSEISGFTSRRSDQNISGKVSSGSQFNTWGWSWNGSSLERSTVGNPTKFHRNMSTGNIFAIPTPSLRLGAAVRYEQIDSLYGKSGKNNGFGPGASIDWAPSTRTSLNGSAFRQFYGNTGQFGLSHRWDKLSLNFSYDKSVISGNDSSFLNINQQQLFNAGGYAAALNPIYRSLVADSLTSSYGVPVGLGVVNDALVLRNGGSAVASYLLPTGFLSLAYTDVIRETIVRTFDPSLGGLSVAGAPISLSGSFLGVVKTKALTFDWEYKFDSRSKLKTQVIYSNNLFPNIQRTTKRISYQATYSTKITSETTASFGLRRFEQSSTGSLPLVLDENSIFSTLDIRF